MFNQGVNQLFLRVVIFVLVSTLLGACSNFSALKQDLTQLKESSIQMNGEIISKLDNDSPVILVLFKDRDGSHIISARVFESPGNFSFTTVDQSQYVFAFQDKNRDSIFQETELYGWFNNANPITPVNHASLNVSIELLPYSDNLIPAPPAFSYLMAEDFLGTTNIEVALGDIIQFDSPMFSSKQAEKGLWQPLSFIKDGTTGIHFQTPYDENKIPVLFVHGINGSPTNFKFLSDNLNRDKYQFWFFNYPSGLRLNMLGSGLKTFLTTLRHQYGFEEMHLVAHSMGGLVSRSYLNQCKVNQSCKYVKSFITISTPWSGHLSAHTGVKYAPEVVPVWRDMSPESKFLEKLFLSPLPNEVPHHLLFSYKGNGGIDKENNDGGVTLSSQLRMEAQQQSLETIGFNESHMSILSSTEVLEYLSKTLN